MPNNRSLPFAKSYLTLSDVSTISTSESELIEMIEGLPVLDSLFVLSEMDKLLIHHSQSERKDQEKLIDLIFDEELGANLKKFLDSDSVIIHRQQLYLCMSYVLRYGNSEIRIEEPNPEKLKDKILGPLAPILLYVNEFCGGHIDIVGSKKVKEKKLAGILWQLGQFTIDSEERNLGIELARAYIVYNESVRGRNIASTFEDVIGVSIDKFWSVVFALYGRWSRKSEFLSGDLVLNRSTYFDHCEDIDGEDLDTIFDLLSEDLPALEEIHQKRLDDFNHEEMNFEFIRENPLLRVGDNYICLSLPYLVNKVTRKIPEILRNTLGGQKYSGRIGNDLGETYGDYIRQQLDRVYNQTENLAERSLHRKFNGIEISDGIIDYGDKAIFIEVKARTIKTKFKLSNNYKDIEKAASSFLTDRGAAQLEERIIEFNEGKTKIPEIDPERVKSYWPILVMCIDELPQHINLTNYYEELMSQYGVLNQDYIAPLTIMGLKDFEVTMNLVQHEGESFIDLIKEKNSDPRLSDMPLFNYITAERNEYIKDKPEHLDKKLEELQKRVPEELGLKFDQFN